MSATLRRRCQTSLGAGSRCKGTIKFADVQENSDFFFAIFSLEDARGASYSLEMRGEEYPNMIRD